MALKYTKVTCTHYQEGDVVGKLLAYAALAPVLLMFYRLSRFYSRREVHEAVFFLGCLASEVLARVLKRHFQQARPAETCQQLNLCHSHGMPSSHTQMMFFIFSLSTLLACYRRGWMKPSVPQKGSKVKQTVQMLVSLVEFAALAAASAAVAVSRVYLGYHSVDQVMAGAVVGSVFGTAWFVVMLALAPVYQKVAQLPVSNWLNVRNTWDLGADVHTFERDFINVSLQVAAKKDK